MVTIVLVLRTVAVLCFATPLLLRIHGRRDRPDPDRRQRAAGRAPVAANFAAFVAFLLTLGGFSGSITGALALPLATSGGLLAGGGAVLVLRSRAALGAAWSLVPVADPVTGLIVAGPYRLVRHPIYLGLALLAMGNATAFGNGPAALVVLCAVVPTFVWRARAEEAVLRGTFGGRYAEYQARTPMIIPRLP
jgi:protein-S-isoprenylcysteine O-methyltransferase Ste14